MPQTDWLTLNKNRRYPFVPATLFDVDTGHNFPGNAAFLDAGFTLGIDSNFVPGRDNVYLDEWRITATNVYFSFKVEYGATADYNPFLCYRWVFSFDITADAGATSFSIPERDLGIIGTENVQNPALGLAFLTIGDISQIVAVMPASVGFFIYVPQVEPALLQTQAGLFVKNLKLANEPRPCPPVCPCIESSSSSSSSSSSLSPGAIQQTVGVGGDHVTWGAASGYLTAQSPLTNDYEFIQISDVTETSIAIYTVDLNGHSVLMRSAVPHNGDPTAGYKCFNSVTGVYCIALIQSGAGHIEIKDLNIQFNNVAGFPYGIALQASTTGTFYVHDNIVFSQTAIGIGILAVFDILPLERSILFNNVTDGWAYGCYPIMRLDNGPIVENCTFLNSASGGLRLWTTATGTGFVRNCVFDNINEAAAGSQARVSGYNNASVNADALDANWAPGSSGNNINITLLNEFVSVTPTNANYGKVRDDGGGVCFNGGIAPTIIANTYGIRLDTRPHGIEISIGADELHVAGSSSSSSSSCADPVPPEPTSATVPIATALPNGTFIDVVKLKEGYNCSLTVVNNIIQIAAGLALGEGMQCEDLRMAADGSLAADSCVVCGGWLYSINSQGADVEHLQLLGGPGVVIDPQPASNRIIVRFDEEGICEVDI